MTPSLRYLILGLRGFHKQVICKNTLKFGTRWQKYICGNACPTRVSKLLHVALSLFGVVTTIARLRANQGFVDSKISVCGIGKGVFDNIQFVCGFPLLLLHFALSLIFPFVLIVFLTVDLFYGQIVKCHLFVPKFTTDVK